MADLILQLPANNENVLINIDEAVASIDLGFAIDEALFEKVGENLEIHFESNDSSIVLQDFYLTYSSENVPDFLVDNSVLSGEDFFAALDSSLMPAAGIDNTIANDGLDNNEVNPDLLAGGLDAFGDTEGGSAYSRQAFQGTFSQDNNTFTPDVDLPTGGGNTFVPEPLPSISISANFTERESPKSNSFSVAGDGDNKLPDADLLEQLGSDLLVKADMTWKDVTGYKPTTNTTELDFNGFTLSAQRVQYTSDHSSYTEIEGGNTTFVWRTDTTEGADASFGLGIFSSSNNDSAYETGFNNQTDQAEIYVVKLDEGTSADSIELQLGTFFDDSHSKDPQPETVIVEFYRDGELIYTETVTSTSSTGSANLSFVVENFDEVRLIPGGNTDISSAFGSDFTLEGITISENLHTISGEVEVENFGDVVAYEIASINGIDVDTLFDTGTIVLDGEAYTYTKSSDNTSFSFEDEFGNAALDIEIDASGSYTVTEHKDLDFELNLSFDVTNANGEELSSQDIQIDLADNVIRGTDADDFISATEASDLIYGGEGNDVFVFDADNFTSASDTIADLNTGDVLDLSAFKASGYVLTFDEAANSISVTNGTDTLDIMLNSSTITDFDMEAMQQDFNDDNGIIKI